LEFKKTTYTNVTLVKIRALIALFFTTYQRHGIDRQIGIEMNSLHMNVLKVHKHEILYFDFFAETETLWSQGPVTRDF
jgi:hypothetical protein